MNEKVAKKIRKQAKRNWMEYIAALYDLPLRTRLLFAWHIITKYKSRVLR